jgi:hypothetical protein
MVIDPREEQLVLIAGSTGRISKETEINGAVMTTIDARYADVTPEFTGYLKEVKDIQKHYKRQAFRSEWLSNAISIALITAGSAVGLTGVAGDLSGRLSALLGFAVVVLEGASRVFKPMCRAVHARQTSHALGHQFRLFAVSARPYTGTRKDAQLKFVENIEKILLKAYTQEDAGGQDSSAQGQTTTLPAGDDKRPGSRLETAPAAA